MTSRQPKPPEMQQPGRAASDPLFLKAGWEPLKRGGANFQTHRLEITRKKISIRRSRAAKLIVFPLLFTSLVFAFLGVTALADNVDTAGVIVTAAALLPFLLAARMAKGMTRGLLQFDKAAGRYFAPNCQSVKGKHPNPSCEGDLSDIYAIQVLKKEVRTSERTFDCYEVNLVLRSGKRVNVLNHGYSPEIKKAATVLSRFLSVPVWTPKMTRQKKPVSPVAARTL